MLYVPIMILGGALHILVRPKERRQHRFVGEHGQKESHIYAYII